MSAADKHRAAAQRSMRLADESSYADAAGQHRATAQTYALLAIEARLGELVDAQHTATLLAGSAYGITDSGLVQQLVNTIGDAMTGTPPGGYGSED